MPANYISLSLTLALEEDKKALVAMLGKLYITANSSAEKLKETTTLVNEAIDDKIASDAASRNALNKLHLALSKAVGEIGSRKRDSNDTIALGDDDGLTVVEGPGRTDGVSMIEEDMKLEAIEEDAATEVRDSLLDELLEDEDEDEDL